MRLIDADEFGVIALQGKSEEFIEGVAFMLDKIDNAPTVEPKNGKWIPCSERLPERDDTGHVLVSVSIPERPFDIVLVPTNCVKHMFKQGHISAWMPLPEPYMEEGDKNDH